MKKLLAFALVLGITAMVVGCSDKKEDKVIDGGGKKPDMPEWVLATPSNPGKAFYGVGSGSFKLGTQQNRAMREADAQARRQIAETMGQKIEAMIKTYAAQIVTEEGQIVEESLSSDVMRAFTDRNVQGAEIIRKYITKEPDANGLYYVYSLAEINFDSVVETLQNAAVNSKAVEAVRQRAENAFADLDKQLAKAQEEAYPNAKPVAAPVEGEVVPQQGAPVE